MGLKDKIDKKDLMKVIVKGGHVQADNEVKKKVWINFCVRIKADMLDQIDKALEDRPGLSKTGWILEAIHKELKRVGNE
jgi:hypothetical protein